MSSSMEKIIDAVIPGRASSEEPKPVLNTVAGTPAHGPFPEVLEPYYNARLDPKNFLEGTPYMHARGSASD
jgi:hypothetical protein